MTADEPHRPQTVYLLLHPCEPVSRGEDGEIIGVRLTIEAAIDVYRGLRRVLGLKPAPLDKEETVVLIATLIMVEQTTDLPDGDRAVIRGLIDKLSGGPVVTIARR